MAYPDDLRQAFERTIYRVFLPTPIDLRVGEAHPGLDAALRALGARSWIVLSPGNPGATRLGAGDNARRMADLVSRLDRHGLRHFQAIGLPPPDQDWEPEASLLILDASPAHARALAARYGQLAWLEGRRGQAPRLAWSPAA